MTPYVEQLAIIEQLPMLIGEGWTADATKGTIDGVTEQSDLPPVPPVDATAEPRPGTEIILRDQPSGVVPPPRWSRAVTTLRTRLPELARHPAVVTAASVGTGIAAAVVREALRGGVRRPSAPTSVTVTGYIRHVHVVHHVVHTVPDRPALPPPS